MNGAMVLAGKGRPGCRRAWYDGPKPILSRVYNSALARWLKVDFCGEALSLTWTGNRDEATVMESYVAETTALSIKQVADALRPGWDAVYAEPVVGAR
jgi:hypothetical protein